MMHKQTNSRVGYDEDHGTHAMTSMFPVRERGMQCRCTGVGTEYAIRSAPVRLRCKNGGSTDLRLGNESRDGTCQIAEWEVSIGRGRNLKIHEIGGRSRLDRTDDGR